MRKAQAKKLPLAPDARFNDKPLHVSSTILCGKVKKVPPSIFFTMPWIR